MNGESNFLAGGGEMGVRIQAYDWASTPLGAIATWSATLASAVQFVLVQNFPTKMCVGQQRTLIYNDAYARLMGGKHPDALGCDVRLVFAEVAARFAPTLDRAFAGETVTLRDEFYPFCRKGEIEEAWFDISYSPVRDEVGVVVAAFVVHNETTERVLAAQHRSQIEAALRAGEARQAFLLELSDTLRPLVDPTDITLAACKALGRYLGVAQAGYAEMDAAAEFVTGLRAWTNGEVPNFTGRRFRLQDFGTYFVDMREGRDVVIDDVTQDERTFAPDHLIAMAKISLAAMVVVPLVKAGQLPAFLYVSHPTARHWAAADIELAHDVAERTWAALEQARAEAALSASEERFRSFAENSADTLWIADATAGRLEYLSPAFEAMWGESRDAVMRDLGRWAALVHPEDRARALEGMPRLLAGQTYQQTYRILRANDGAERHIQDTGFAIRDAEGDIRRVGGIAQDTTEARKVEEKLRDSEARQRALIEGLPQLVWRSADGGDWTWAGPQWCTYTGLSDETSRGHGWLDALHPEDRATALDAWARAELDRVLQVDCRIRHSKSGRFAWFQTRGISVRDNAGKIVEWIGTYTDINDQMQARAVLARSRDELEALVAARTAQLTRAEESLRQAQKMEAVGQLTGGIAHDFNNMLQGVVGGLAMARRQIAVGKGGEAVRYLDAAQEATKRAAGLTRRLLAFARRQQLEPKPVNADGLITGLADLIRRTVGPSINIDLQLANRIGSVVCDPNELESALLNLCINARDAMPEGGRLVIGTDVAHLSAADIEEEEAKPGRYVAISVEDTGTGMTPEVMARVFEPFFTTKPLGAGTGLGLSQVYGFVRQSGGIVRIRSTPGQGTTIRLLLPLDESMEAPREEPVPPSTLMTSYETVLLVDDEDAVRQPTADRLRELGYTVLEARDGPEAMRTLAMTQPDLLITDVGLPNGMNGRQLAEVFRERMPGLPVLFITGYAGTSLPPGIEMVSKPFELDTLAQRVQTLLERGPGINGGKSTK